MIADDDEVEYEYETIEVSHFSFEITTISFLPIEKLMSNQAIGVEISGQKVWCGSLYVVDYILRNREVIEKKLVIELGAGTGILGMVCSRLHCKELILTDNDPKSIKHMKQDCSKNFVFAEVKELDWFAPDISKLGITIDESTPEICIVAGDVLYKHVLLEPFFKTTRLLLDLQKNASMLLCHVPRAGVNYSDVIQAAESNGLLIEQITVGSEDKQNVRKHCPEDDISRARLFSIKIR